MKLATTHSKVGTLTIKITVKVQLVLNNKTSPNISVPQHQRRTNKHNFQLSEINGFQLATIAHVER